MRTALVDVDYIGTYPLMLLWTWPCGEGQKLGCWPVALQSLCNAPMTVVVSLVGAVLLLLVQLAFPHVVVVNVVSLVSSHLQLFAWRRGALRCMTSGIQNGLFGRLGRFNTLYLLPSTYISHCSHTYRKTNP